MIDCKKLVKLLLVEKDSSITELAARMGCARSTISDKLIRNDLRVSELEAVAAAYDCELVVEFREKKVLP